MKRWMLCLCLAVMMAGGAARAEEKKPEEPKEKKPRHSVAHKVIFYLPNRAFDILDMVRLRLRVGPGLAVGVRATEPLSAYAGAYVSVYGGLPGPRQKRRIPIPVGFESYNGATLSVVHVATGAGLGPDYSPTEIGGSLHLLLIGADVNVDPMELVDLLAGIFCFDPRNDDF